MKYSLTRQTNNPSRGHAEDAGIDIYVPTFNLQFIQAIYELNPSDSFYFITQKRILVIPPHKRIKLPTGVYFNIPAGNMLIVLQKTSVPNKTGIISGARVIDENYQGEFIASLINTSDVQAILQQNQKFIQLVLTPIHKDRYLQEVEFKDLYEQKTQRGQGAYGSTDLF